MFTAEMKVVIRGLLAKLSEPSILVFPDRDGIEDSSQLFFLCRDASREGLGATLEQEQPDRSTHPMVYLSHARLPNKRNWPPVELEAGAIV